MKLVFLTAVVLCALHQSLALDSPRVAQCIYPPCPELPGPRGTKPTTKAPCATKSTTKAPCATKSTTKAPLPVCPTNEVYSECGASGCVNTCANPTFASISRCACVPGCICIDGYLRNSKKVCVAPSQCDTCKENEEFSECDAHGCRNTCAEPDLITRCSYVAGCYPGCICKEGFLKNTDGVCVAESTCVNRCPNPNESYSECGTACPKTCDNKDIAIMCTYQCVAGCFCNDGYVRDASGTCILAESCPKKCPEGEVHNSCGTACPRTCENKDAMIKCTDNCVDGCFCMEGYVRDKNNRCIPERDCPLVCGPNQVVNECPSCPKGQICPAVCIPRCECKPGYISDSTGVCIKKPPPQPTCGANEVYDKCPPGSPAELSCVNIFKGTKSAYPSPCKEGCKCKPGFVRIGKACVVEAKCCSDPNAELVKIPDSVACGKKSDVKGCQCKKGYSKKSESDATCVPVKNCNKPLPVPEIY